MTPLEAHLRRLIASIEYAWTVVIQHIIRLLSRADKSPAQLKAEVRNAFNGLDRANRLFVRQVVPVIFHSEYRAAEDLLDQPVAQIDNVALARHAQAFYAVLSQMSTEAQRTVQRIIDQGYTQHMPVADGLEFQKTLAQALPQSIKIGSRHYDPPGASKALVRTRVNQLQNEAALERYKLSGVVAEVEFHVGTTPCNFQPVTCEELDGKRWPIDAIPPEYVPPRHIYGNSRLLPVVR